MKAEQVLQHLSNEVQKPEKENIQLNKEQVKTILNKVDYLESVAAAFLKSQIDGAKGVVLPYRTKAGA